MLDLLRPEVRASADALRGDFAAAEPFRHVVIDAFVEDAFCHDLIREFPAFDPVNALNEFGEAGRKAVVTGVARIGPAYARFDRMIRSREFLDWLGQVASIENLVYDPDYVGGGTHENLEGQDLDSHVDFNFHPRRPLHRRLNLILFLNPEWRPQWGGCLQLERDPWHPVANVLRRKVVPLANRCVIFETTETSWHGFDRIQLPAERRNLSRRSIAVYFYTTTRPPAETASSHGTIYAPRPLPRQFEAGHTLDAEDVQELEILLARRDRQIQYLYERELEFSKTLAGIYRSPSFRIGRALTWPLRKIRAKRR
ncbi:MAG: 2OG-Fe(II) oxygenase [Bryobacteraceae bacterium]|nr:2OG-Fe(II) oxygenase [Bryobacteraceae bacterium]